MADVSISKALELKTSRSGRLLIPRLRNWTGERVVMNKAGLIQVFDGSPDCTSTFVSERKLFQAATSLGFSQSLNISVVKSRSPSKLMRIKGSESLPIPLKLQENSKRGQNLTKTHVGLKTDEPAANLTRRRSPRKKCDLPSSNSKSLSVKVSQRRVSLDKPEVLRKSRPITQNASSGRLPRDASTKASNVPPSRLSPLKGHSIPSSKLHEKGALATRSSPRKKPNRSPTKPPKEIKNTPATRSSPRKKLDTSPTKASKTKTRESGSFKNNIGKSKREELKNQSKRKPDLVEKADKNLVRNEAAEKELDVDIFAPEFQPVVRLVRLLPEEILSITCSPKKSPVKTPQKDPPASQRDSSSRKRKSPPDCKVKTPAKAKPEKLPWKMRVSPLRGGLRTVKGTQKILEALQNPTSLNEIEDEATSTGAFFKNSCANALENLHEVDDILNNDFGESDDNLSFRSTFERESSPMPSVPVSPISSFVETDAENSGWEDGLLGESPMVAKPTSFQKAQLLHRTLKSRAAVTKKLTKLRKEVEESSSSTVLPSFAKAATNPVPCSLLQPKAMLALEKNLKKKAKNGEKLHFETIYRGNKLHISLNSSDSESSVDSFDSD